MRVSRSSATASRGPTAPRRQSPARVRSASPEPPEGRFSSPPPYPDQAPVSTETPTSENPLTVAAVAAPPRRRRSRLPLLGVLVSVVALAAVVWWASKQQAPRLPHTPGQLLALVGAVALYGLATLVRGERWQRLMRDEGGTPPRVDTYSLVAIGYMGNNVLPARAGDAIRVVLM